MNILYPGWSQGLTPPTPAVIAAMLQFGWCGHNVRAFANRADFVHQNGLAYTDLGPKSWDDPNPNKAPAIAVPCPWPDGTMGKIPDTSEQFNLHMKLFRNWPWIVARRIPQPNVKIVEVTPREMARLSFPEDGSDENALDPSDFPMCQVWNTRLEVDADSNFPKMCFLYVMNDLVSMADDGDPVVNKYWQMVTTVTIGPAGSTPTSGISADQVWPAILKMATTQALRTATVAIGKGTGSNADKLSAFLNTK